ncbi:MAG: zinc ribbon domain-containing protein [Gaiellaceae bacterium]
MREGVRTCPACRLAVADEARFCPSCGSRLDGEAGGIPATRSERRVFGVPSPVPLLVLACVVLAGSLASLIARGWILGFVLLAFAAALFVLFYGAAERDPSTPAARAALGAVGRVTSSARLARESAGAWGGAGRRLFELRRELRPLREERHQVLLALGDAAYREDEATVASLRARIAEIDDAIAERERNQADALAAARARVEDERVATRETQHLPPDDVDGRADAS